MLAGPGAGKTRALVRLYADLVKEGVPRSRILVLTFSTSAAGEITRRVDELLSDSYDRAFVATFHGFCARLLQDHAPDPRRLLLSGFQEWMAMRAVLSEMEPGGLGPLAPVRRSEAFAQDALAFVALLKQALVHPAPFALLAETGGSERLRALAAVFGAYQARLAGAHLADFRDLVTAAIALLSSRARLLDSLRGEFTHFLVDEFQDVDPAQFELLRLLAPPERSPRLVVFGDPDQSIYGFRGTRPELLERDFERVYGARTLRLEVGHRCPPEVMAAGRRLLAATQPAPAGAPARPEAGPQGGLEAWWEAGPADEAMRVARSVKEAILESRGGLGPGDFAILLRSTSAAAAPFGQALASLGIPHEVRGHGGLAGNEVVRFLLAYLRSLASPEDEGALAELLGSDLAGGGRRILSRLRAHAAEEGRPLARVLNRLLFHLAEKDPARFPLPWGGPAPGPGGQTRPAPPYLEFMGEGDLERLHGAACVHRRLRGAAGRLPLGALAYSVLEETGLLARLLQASLPEAERRRGLSDLRLALSAFQDAEEVWRRLHGRPPRLQDVAGELEAMVERAVSESEAAPAREPGAVQVMTVHQSKGLEFEVVFLSGFAEGVFPVRGRPHPLLDEGELAWLEASLPGLSTPQAGGQAGHVAEEARLAYVAMTRARRRLHVTRAAEYGSATGPSPFLELALPGRVPLPPALGSGPVAPDGVLTRHEAEVAAAGLRPGLDAEALAALGELGCDLEFITDPELGERFLPHLAGRPRAVEPHHFSATELTAYLKCPRLYWYGHHPGLVPAPRSPEMARGGFLHRVLEDFHRREAEWRDLPPAAQREWLEEAFQGHLEDYLERVEPLLDRRREELQVRQVLDNYLRFATRPQRVPRRGTLATEKRFVLHLDGAEIHGVIDRINDTGGGTCEVVDYKTGRGMPLRRAYETYFGEHPYDVQLAMYYLACIEGVDEEGRPLDLRPRFLSLWYPKDLLWGNMRQVLFAVGEPAGLKAWMEQALAEKDLEGARSTVREAVASIRAGRFEPRPREAPGTCLSFSGCPHQAVCPLARAAVE